MNRINELFVIASVWFCTAVFGTLAVQLKEDITTMGIVIAFCYALAAGFGAIAFHVFKKEKGEDGQEREVLALAIEEVKKLKGQVEAL